ncbi:MAG TPA: hypothetical protein VF341_04555 [Anaeromyxobacteraceae bacterium]
MAGLVVGCGSGASSEDTFPAPPPNAGPSSARHRAVTLGDGGAPNGFYEYLPPAYPSGAAWPLLVFWHGIGENGNGGSELSRVLANGPPKLIAEDRWPAERPFVVLSAQHAGGGCPSSGEVQAFVAWATAAYRINPKFVFMTGLSCGAIGAWSYLGDHPDEVAAAVLIAGDPGSPTSSSSAWGKQGCSLGKVAISAFHGDADGTVNIGNERATMAKLLACPSPPARGAEWTEVAGGGHGIWGGIYDLTTAPDVYAWMLAHHKP